ncbi:hypothetical protein [Nocardia sp. alder85J]|uniref:hypothetical protein n=1 Tax=Nocardia sp. alder85J TaxID=2862949 RepID=UPI001CD75C4D|nr:hypothetical protein [Nocardia sp. alder85J]MCX4097772.1 hypothetical protein [Nocardia sp. alder85J]
MSADSVGSAWARLLVNWDARMGTAAGRVDAYPVACGPARWCRRRASKPTKAQKLGVQFVDQGEIWRLLIEAKIV